MIVSENKSLLPHNTFNIDVKAAYFIEYDSVEDLQKVLKADILKNQQLLPIGSGSNLLFLDNFNGVILHSRNTNISIESQTEDFIYLNVGAGLNWDQFVLYCINNNYYGIENLSLIPGEIGASAVQNIGAYGVEVKDLIFKVFAVEIQTGNVREFTNDECNYAYRESIFKKELKGKYIITSVTYQLKRKPAYTLNYQHLDNEVEKLGKITLNSIRETIVRIRQSKLPDPVVLGNAGSFFMNPIIKKSVFMELQNQFPTMPNYKVSDDLVKLSAAWLIDQCGWKGKRIGDAGVHDKQALVLVNYRKATGSEIVELAKSIQQSVIDKFKIKIHPEVNFIG